jgi:hypothetical protein
MISEKQFASEFSGFWAETLPFLTPQAIAELNLSGTAMGDGRREWMKPLAASGDNSNNDVIAETAFGLFTEALKSEVPISKLLEDAKLIQRIEESAKSRVFDLRREAASREHSSHPKTSVAIDLATRLETYFEDYPLDSIVIQPRFKGCGILDSCYGDILARKSLCELKMVDRNLRSADIRQVLAYCALNYRSSQYEIESVTILNPRRGLEFSFVVEELAERASGKNASELFHQITTFLADFETVHQPS